MTMDKFSNYVINNGIVPMVVKKTAHGERGYDIF